MFDPRLWRRSPLPSVAPDEHFPLTIEASRGLFSDPAGHRNTAGTGEVKASKSQRPPQLIGPVTKSLRHNLGFPRRVFSRLPRRTRRATRAARYLKSSSFSLKAAEIDVFGSPRHHRFDASRRGVFDIIALTRKIMRGKIWGRSVGRQVPFFGCQRLERRRKVNSQTCARIRSALMRQLRLHG